MMNEQNGVTRRGFLGTAGLATGAVASGTLAHPAIGSKHLDQDFLTSQAQRYALLCSRKV